MSGKVPQPKFEFGQAVKVKLKAKTEHKIEISQEIVGYVTEINLNVEEYGYYYKYGIAESLPIYYASYGNPFLYLTEKEVEQQKI